MWMRCSRVASFVMLAEFLCCSIDAMHLERYLESYPDAIPFDMLSAWRTLCANRVHNRKALHRALNAHCASSEASTATKRSEWRYASNAVCAKFTVSDAVITTTTTRTLR